MNEAPRTGPRERILVVDDEAGIRELLLVLFRKNLYQAVAAADANDGFTLAAEVEPAVAIVDYHIAGGGGINLIRKLREHLPDIRCIFMTAHDAPEYFEQALEAGAADTIRKPFDILLLLAKVERLIELRKRERRGVVVRRG
jgi:two-component system response regulator (stage 0 sporulation protein F)